MATRRTIRPAPGKKVRKPLSLVLLSPRGESVVWTTFWQRRLDAGDVVLEPDVQTSARKPQPEPEETE